MSDIENALRDRAIQAENALREILFTRPPGPIPKLVKGELIERIENIAKAALSGERKQL
jgi:hypothetical protein